MGGRGDCSRVREYQYKKQVTKNITQFKHCDFMDQEDFIKIQHESEEKGGDHFLNYMTQFYDHDSADGQDLVKRQDGHQSTETINSAELLDRLESLIDFRSMNLENITLYAKENFRLTEEIDWDEFEKRIKKRKLILKRNHAKHRNVQDKKNEYFVISDSVEGTDIKEQIQAQIKKKRNRMSAQISRDRKKIQIQELQVSNKKLKEETEKIMQENQKLKKQLEEFNRVEEKKVQSSKGKNKFLSLLIMFGMFFLLTILRESVKSGPLKVIGKISKLDNEVFSAQEQAKIIENGQKTFQNYETAGEQLLGNHKIMKNVMFKLEEMKSAVEDVPISKTLKQELQFIQKHVN